jgi:pimeloyl-ACP methyl ester carboxylesterase
MKKAYTDVSIGQIHYLVEGNGEPLLLLHMSGSSADEYRRVLPFLSKAYRAIAMDLPGFGASDKPPFEYQMADYADAVIGFMDSLGILKPVIIGHRASAAIALEIAATRPERVKKLVLVSLPYNPDFGQHRARRDLPDFSRVEIAADGKHLAEWWRRAARYGDKKEIVEERALDFHKAGPRGEELHWALFAYDPTPRLPLVKCPTLLLSGTQKASPSPLDQIQKLIPNSKITIIENSPAYITRVIPDKFAAAILAFLSES